MIYRTSILLMLCILGCDARPETEPVSAPIPSRIEVPLLPEVALPEPTIMQSKLPRAAKLRELPPSELPPVYSCVGKWTRNVRRGHAPHAVTDVTVGHTHTANFRRVSIDEAIGRPDATIVLGSNFRWMSDAASTALTSNIDTGAFARAMADIRANRNPRIEPASLINYFDYDYPRPAPGETFGITIDGVWSPITEREAPSVLLRVGLQAEKRPRREPMHTVVVVAPSMDSREAIGIAKTSLRIFARSLLPDDTIAVIADGVGREAVRASSNEAIERKIREVRPFSRGLEEGLKEAYAAAASEASEVNDRRVLLLSAGRNGQPVYPTDLFTRMDEIAQSEQARGVELTAVTFKSKGFGDTHLAAATNAARWRAAADAAHYYVDHESEVHKVFGEKLARSMQPIARDVKIEVEFPLDIVEEARVYEKVQRRMSGNEYSPEFGTFLSGDSVTNMLDVLPRDEVRPDAMDDVIIVRVRYKTGASDETEQELTRSFKMSDVRRSLADTDASFKLAVAAAAAAVSTHSYLELVGGPAPITLDWIKSLVDTGSGHRDRGELVRLIEALQRRAEANAELEL